MRMTFKFEQCCPIFYKMANNGPYLSQKHSQNLEFEAVSMFIIDDLPMSTLLVQQTSNLQEIKFNHQWQDA